MYCQISTAYILQPMMDSNQTQVGFRSHGWKTLGNLAIIRWPLKVTHAWADGIFTSQLSLTLCEKPVERTAHAALPCLSYPHSYDVCVCVLCVRGTRAHVAYKVVKEV